MHISLDQALGRESSSPSRVGDRLLQKTGGAAMAFSLRALTGNGGNALRIRRSSDNVEVNVGFDGSGAISTTSPITNVAEPTSISFSSTWDIVTGTPASSTLSPLTSFSITDAPSGFIVRLPITTAIAAGNSVDVSTYISTLSGIWSYYLGDFGGGVVSNIETITSGTTLPTLTATGTPYAIYLRSNSTASSFGVSYGWGGTVTIGDTTSTNLGDFISGTDAHVVTWYDQSGNGNDFTNSITSTQPKIASSGSYLGYIDFDADTEVLKTESISNIPSGDQSYHLVQAEGAAAPTTFNITFWNLGFSHYIYYGNTQVTSGFSVGVSTGAANTRGEFNQFSVLGSLSPNQQITTRNTLAYSAGGGVSNNPPALFTARLGNGNAAAVNSKFKIKELVFLNTVDSDIVNEVSSSQTTYFETPD